MRKGLMSLGDCRCRASLDLARRVRALPAMVMVDVYHCPGRRVSSVSVFQFVFVDLLRA